jgi:CDGSH-type Zn-finger protein
MHGVTITATDNGPNLVRGTVTLLDAEGNEYEASEVIALCRCGHSGTKPFCDGTHERVRSRPPTGRRYAGPSLPRKATSMPLSEK